MKPGSFNQTAYRILLLVTWLVERPMTFDEINKKFESEPNIGKKISRDTLWLYTNTLKAIGCEVSRPTSKNGFCYRVNYHPFSYFLTESKLHSLKEAVLYSSEYLDYWDIFYFSQWLQKLFWFSANKDKESLKNRFFADTRLTGIEAVRTELVEELERYCSNDESHKLLQVQYCSSNGGHKSIIILPQKIFHYRNILYLLGQSPDWENSSMLRLDKIINVTPFDDPELYQKLSRKQLQNQRFVIRFLNCPLEEYEPLGENEEVSKDPDCNKHLIVEIKTDSEFILKQKLLSSGYQFQIISPVSFKREIQTTLQDMRKLYLT